VLAATEERANESPDHQLLALATSEQRVMVTQDIRFRVLAQNWQRIGKGGTPNGSRLGVAPGAVSRCARCEAALEFFLDKHLVPPIIGA
jgi:hypothetical protein